MTRNGDERRSADRLDQLVARLLRDRRLRIDERDIPNRGAVRMAAFLAGARRPHPRSSYRHRQRLERLIRADGDRHLMSRRELIAASLGSAAGFTGGLVLSRLLPESSPPAKGQIWRPLFNQPKADGLTSDRYPTWTSEQPCGFRPVQSPPSSSSMGRSSPPYRPFARISPASCFGT